MLSNRNMFLKILSIAFLLLIMGCQNDILNNSNEGVNKEVEQMNVKLTIDGKNYNVTFANNKTAKAFIDSLPKEFFMSELNGNEKYVYMDFSLPTDASKVKKINAGDIMLYGDDCLVIFYKTFETQYSYTKIGHIDNLPDLGSGNIKANFTK